jgi:cell division protein FtsI/penicillin-binding protein 2
MKTCRESAAALVAGFLLSDEPQFACAAVYEGEVGSKVHGGSTAGPMIADIFKQVYKNQQVANGRQQRREPQRGQQIRRAEPVEEDESD